VCAGTGRPGIGVECRHQLGAGGLRSGKSDAGCSPPYSLGSIYPGGSAVLYSPDFSIYTYSQPLVEQGSFTEASLMALLVKLDHNGDGLLCYKIPAGWVGPPSANAAGKSGFWSLVDDFDTISS
jgi:hypothetical protein